VFLPILDPRGPFLPERQAEYQEAISRQNAQRHWNRFPQLDSSRDGATTEQGRIEQAELLPIRLATAQPSKG